jgi:hypothetical protein
MHRGPHRASEQGRHREDRGVAGPVGDHFIGLGLQCAAERFRAHLADKVRGLVYLALAQRRHAVDRGHSAGTHRFPDELARHVGARMEASSLVGTDRSLAGEEWTV